MTYQHKFHLLSKQLQSFLRVDDELSWDERRRVEYFIREMQDMADKKERKRV